MGLRKGLSLIRGMRRSLTEDEQHKVATAVVERLESTNSLHDAFPVTR